MTSTYWQGRREALLAQMESDEARLFERLSRLYASEAAKLEREIASYYARYGEGNVIRYRTLLAELSEADRRLLIERCEDFARKYPQWAHLLPVRKSIYMLNELEGIQASIRMRQLEIGAIEQDEFEAHFERQSQRAANLAAEEMGFGKNFYAIDAPLVQATVGAAWATGESYSERIWGNRERLAAYLNNDFAKGIARGLSYDKLSQALRERFENVSAKDAKRLVYTEGTFLFNESQAQVHEQDFQMYSIKCVNDGRVCPVCRDLQSEQGRNPVRFDERAPGVNFPPMHPWCRCTYVTEVADWDAWIDAYVAARGGDLVTGVEVADGIFAKSTPTSDEPKTPDYSLFSAKQKRKQLTDNELAGHEKLASCGLDVKPIPIDRSAPASIDLYIDGELWELKTPTMTGGMLRKRINEGVSKWRRLHEHGLMLDDYPRIVVDNRFCEMGDGEASEIIVERMGVHEPGRFDQAMLVRKDGILVRIWRK